MSLPLLRILLRSLSASQDKRGKKKLTENELYKRIDAHIKTYNPSISHYRREQPAPNRLYLPSDLSVKHMHVDFNEKNPEQNIHYTTYLRRVNAMNICFAQLGQEEV